MYSILLYNNYRYSKYRPEDVALSCNPSYWEARIVGWLEVDRPQHYKPMDFWSRTKAAPIVVGLQDSNRSYDDNKLGVAAASQHLQENAGSSPGRVLHQYSQTLFIIM
jgi:hypothetical protein